MSEQNFSNFIEKRIFRRVDSELKVSLLFEGKKIPAKATNISCGGIYLNLKSKKYEFNKDLEVAIHLPNRKNPVVLVAEIIRQNNGDSGVALKFQGLYNDMVLEIEKYIKSKMH